MADLAIGLAKSVVEGTLSKATAAIEEELKLRQSAKSNLVFITGEFQMMQSFLKVANAERVENPVVMTWVRQIRELAYDVEDCIEFVVHLDTNTSCCWWWRRLIPSWCMVPPLPLDKAVMEIEQLKVRVEDVSTRNARYSLISDTGSKPAIVQQNPAAATGATALGMLIGARDAGRRQLQGDLTQLLANDKIQVISVWGTSGDLGVTTIIWKAYNDQETCQNFTCRAWVKIKHPFDPIDFVRCLASQFYANSCKEQQGEIIGVDVLKRSLEDTQDDQLEEFVQRVNNERYLVVLENLSTITDWDTISKFFPSWKNGSCIIVSTQQPEVATLSVGNPYQVLDLNQFSVDHSVYAFYKEGSQCGRDKVNETGDNKASSSSLATNSVRRSTSRKMSVKRLDSRITRRGQLSSKKEAAEHWMNNHSLFGRESEMNDLRQYITKARFNSIQVMSVWGIVGVGKSALIKNLFCDRISLNIFQKYGWVEVSHPFNLRDFSRSLLLSFDSESIEAMDTAYSDTMGSRNPILECRAILKQHRCLVAIDGLQSTDEWDLIQADLVSGSSKNSIIVITTDPSVAKLGCGNKGELVFNVKGLQADVAFDLFIKKVSASKHPLHSSLSNGDLLKLKELVSKCGGLPKVIIEIASSLASKSVRRMDSARSINDKFMHVLENDREFGSLQGLFGWIRTYFHTCPDSLKPCIFYLSIFPRDQIIRRRRLVRRWIAEGYSKDKHEESAEEYGEKHFSDLIALSIIQKPPEIARTTPNDTRMVMCQANGFIREYIVSRRIEENLVFELGGSCALTTQRTGRHLVILESWDRDRIVFESMDFSRLRSLTVFGRWESFFISESMKLLRVLDLEDAPGVQYEDLENIMKWLCRLKFLSLRGRREIDRLPSSLDHLRQLQTLDVRDTSIVTLPESIIELQKLQYIRAGGIEFPASTPPHVSSNWFCRRRHRLVGVMAPGGIGKLRILHTLGVINVAASGAKAMAKELKNLTQVRKLGLSGINRNNSGKMFAAIKGHAQLESLSLELDKDNQGCCFNKDNNQGCLAGMESLPLENLLSLKVYGLNDKLPEWSNWLRKLAKLNLEMAILTEDDAKLLGELPHLCILRVKLIQDGKLNFHVIVNGEDYVSYKKLKVLQIACACSSGTFEVTFGSKTMKQLELLVVDCCNESPTYKFSDLQNLSELKQVSLLNDSNAETLKLGLHDLLAQIATNSNKPAVNLKCTN